MRNNIFFKGTICLLLLGIFEANAQEERYVEPTGLNNWFVELGGTAFLYSLNYEKVLYRNSSWGWTGRVGIAWNFTNYKLLNKVDLEPNMILTPFTTSVLYGKRKEKLELGGGFTLINKGVTDREVIPTAIIGFRVVETNKVFFRIAYTPFIRNREYTHWYGVSIGRNFNF